MLDGFQYVLAQIGFVVAVTALLAGVLGWLIGRSNGRRRAEKAAAQSASARPVVAEEPAPDRTVIRMPPTSGGSGTTLYLPATAVDTYFAPVASPAPTVEASSVRVVTFEEVQFLRQELRKRDLEIGRIEAGALSAWDRMVPQLEQQIEDLMAESDSLRRRLREAEEHSDADALSIDHLRALVAGRDTKIAELRAQG